MALTVSVDEIVQGSRNPLLAVKPHWKRVRLGDVASVLNGFAFKSSQFSKGDGTPLIRIRDVGNSKTETNYVGEADIRYIVEPGDLLIGMDGDFNCARWRGPRGLLNQRVCKVSLRSNDYDERFLDYALPGYLKAINGATSSVTVKHLSSRTIEDIPLPCPPRREQEEIVAELEKQFSRLDEAVANLKRVKANLKRYKASVLNAAVEGRLAPLEADLARPDGGRYETGGTLLDQVLDARRKQWSGKGKYKEPAAPDIDALPSLPNGWTWATIEQLTLDLGNGFGKRSQAGGHPRIVLRLADVVRGEISLKDVRRINCLESDESKYGLSVGDLLILRVNGSPDLVGRIALVRHAPEVLIFCDHFIRARCLSLRLAQWIKIYADTDRFRRFVDVNKVSSAGQNTISQGTLLSFAVPLPPSEEQKRILEQVERTRSIAEALELQLDASFRRSARTREALLAAAFGRTAG